MAWSQAIEKIALSLSLSHRWLLLSPRGWVQGCREGRVQQGGTGEDRWRNGEGVVDGGCHQIRPREDGELVHRGWPPLDLGTWRSVGTRGCRTLLDLSSWSSETTLGSRWGHMIANVEEGPTPSTKSAHTTCPSHHLARPSTKIRHISTLEK